MANSMSESEMLHPDNEREKYARILKRIYDAEQQQGES